MLKNFNKTMLIFVFAVLLGCTANKEPIINDKNLFISMQTGKNINVGDSPLYVVIYQLKTAVPFTTLNFKKLSNYAYENLADSYISSENYYLTPNENRNIKLILEPKTQYIGIFAEYKKMNMVKWQDVIALQSLKDKKILIQFNSSGILVKNNAKR